MRAQLDDTHAPRRAASRTCGPRRGRSTARYGYGLASRVGRRSRSPRSGRHSRSRSSRAARCGSSARTRRSSCSRRSTTALRVERPGMFSRSEAWWGNRRLRDDPARRGGSGVLDHALLELDGEPPATPSTASSRTGTSPASATGDGDDRRGGRAGRRGDARAVALAPRLRLDGRFRGGSPAARSSALPAAGRATANRVPAQRRALGAPRRRRRRRWPGAPMRATTRSCSRSRTTFLPENAGRWRVETVGVGRTDDAADLRLDVDGARLRLPRRLRLRRSRARLARRGAAARSRRSRADALFRVSALPWCPEIF